MILKIIYGDKHVLLECDHIEYSPDKENKRLHVSRWLDGERTEWPFHEGYVMEGGKTIEHLIYRD